MARPGVQHCPMPHDIATNRPRLRVFLLTPSLTPQPLLDLLGVSDQELQGAIAKGHPYAFNMGSGKTIPYQNYQEAARVLMDRGHFHSTGPLAKGAQGSGLASI